jgi:hypothetical protein
MLMSDFQSIEKLTNPESKNLPAPEGSSAAKAAALPPCQPKDATQNESTSPKKLTADEQMALYEKALKEDDWGHQPC